VRGRYADNFASSRRIAPAGTCVDRDPIFEVRRCGWKRHECAAACDRVTEPELDVEFFYEPLMLTDVHQPSFARNQVVVAGIDGLTCVGGF
jgi:hypothetical protein